MVVVANKSGDHGPIRGKPGLTLPLARSFRRCAITPPLIITHPTLSSSSPSSPFTSPSSTTSLRLTLYDHLSSGTLTTLERLLLYSLSHEGNQGVRRKSVDTVCDVCKQGMVRGRPWHALQAQVFTMANQPQAGLRESAYRVFAGCPNLVMDLQTDAVLQVFQRGLKDGESVEVRFVSVPLYLNKMLTTYPSVLRLSVRLRSCPPSLVATRSRPRLSALDPVYPPSTELDAPTRPIPLTHVPHPRNSALPLPKPPATSSLPFPFPLSLFFPRKPSSNTVHLTRFLTALTPLCSTNPALFQPHLSALLSFMPQLILPAVDCGPTPTVIPPFPHLSVAHERDPTRIITIFPPFARLDRRSDLGESEEMSPEVKAAAESFDRVYGSSAHPSFGAYGMVPDERAMQAIRSRCLSKEDYRVLDASDKEDAHPTPLPHSPFPFTRILINLTLDDGQAAVERALRGLDEAKARIAQREGELINAMRETQRYHEEFERFMRETPAR
ncbi:hypothetical protein NMY22_g14107 [Coprinellus aureogranulatus]|nr:hypothetical protein NMY22_g14107 [Coprinellus aureogranulatus]